MYFISFSSYLFSCWFINVSILTVTALMVERYLDTYHTSLVAKYKLSSLDRGREIVSFVWLVTLLFYLALRLLRRNHDSKCTSADTSSLYLMSIFFITVFIMPTLLISTMYLIRNFFGTDDPLTDHSEEEEVDETILGERKKFFFFNAS